MLAMKFPQQHWRRIPRAYYRMFFEFQMNVISAAALLDWMQMFPTPAEHDF